MEHHVSSIIRGYHVSKSFWTPAIDEIVTAITEDSNTVRIGGPEKLGSRATAGLGGSEARRCGSGDVHCHIIAPAPSRKH